MTDTLASYDKKLLAVLDKHEGDFLEAYRTHMMKVEKELAILKNKAKD
jgi:predicted secreted Zn-dependent protease